MGKIISVTLLEWFAKCTSRILKVSNSNYSKKKKENQHFLPVCLAGGLYCNSALRLIL